MSETCLVEALCWEATRVTYRCSILLTPTFDIVTMSSRVSQQRAPGMHDDLLSQYDDGHVMDDSEQERVVEQIQQENHKANYIYRIGMLVIYGLIFFMYATPIPTYLTGNHPKSHMTLYFHGQSKIGTEEDLTYLPAFPIYMTVTSIIVAIMYLAAYECAMRAGFVKLKGMPFPYQPHPYGTAPKWIVPVLQDLRLQQTKKERADNNETQRVELIKVLPPQIVYIGFLWVCTWPIPLITFGAGAFDDAAWWSFGFIALSIHLIVEWWIYKAERDTIGLNGMKYNYKSA